MVLSFETLSFSQVTKLYHQYRRYFEEWNKMCPPEEADSIACSEQDSVMMDLTNDLDESDMQLEKLTASPRKHVGVKFEEKE